MMKTPAVEQLQRQHNASTTTNHPDTDETITKSPWKHQIWGKYVLQHPNHKAQNISKPKPSVRPVHLLQEQVPSLRARPRAGTGQRRQASGVTAGSLERSAGHPTVAGRWGDSEDVEWCFG